MVNVSGNSHARAQSFALWHIKLQVNQSGLDSILIQYTMDDAASSNSETKAEAFGESESSIFDIESGSLITKQAQVSCTSVAFTSCARSDARESVAVFTIEDPGTIYLTKHIPYIWCTGQLKQCILQNV